jgi:hypothetical protein
MDALKLLESIEEFLYRTALWVLLIPRTIMMVVRRPNRIYPYVAGELAKKPEDRFKEFLSPVLLWTLTALVPHIMLLDLLATLPGSRVATESEWQAVVSAPWSTRLVIVAVVALAGPLAFARGSLLELKSAVDRDTLRQPFFVQCYCFTPAYIALLPIVYFQLRYDAVPAGAPRFVVTAAWLVFAGWLVIAETAVLTAQLGVSRRSAVIKTCRYLGSALLLLFILELFVITLYNGVAVWTN